VQGLSGIEYCSANGGPARGMHGTLSTRDVHNVLLAAGPAFRNRWRATAPSSNVDIAPTVAHLLNVSLTNTAGRVLHEALSAAKATTLRIDQPSSAIAQRRNTADTNG